MRFFYLLLASVGPGLLWLWFFYRQDRYEPEPVRKIIKVFLVGLILVLPAGLLEQIWRDQMMESIQTGDWVSFLGLAFLVIALIEEGLKTIALIRMTGNSHELNEPVDGPIYGITMGLGFASLENLLWASIFGFGVAILRAAVTTLAHASFSGWMGFYVSKYRLESNRDGLILWKGFLAALIAHGTYDFLLFLRTPFFSLLAFLLIGTLLVRLFQVIHIQVGRSPYKG
ncbi:MAG: PrsW family intramembrane metalloprotease [Firmicutes bacterium]|nr:PrsW family intramembrane metalloprotease [Bacillota bacterium]